MAEEKIEKGAISEEALEEIAGGLSISTDTLKKVAIGAGVTIFGVGGTAVLAIGGKKLHDYYKEKKSAQDVNNNHQDDDDDDDKLN